MTDDRKARDFSGDYAEGNTYAFDGPESIAGECLQAFPYHGVRQTIECRTDEFSAVCPFSGLPDIATVIVTYVPDKVCVELKSLKYYYVSFRNVGIYQEAATDRIFRDLQALLKPAYLKVQTVYNTRGGIDTTCTVEDGER